uniref:Oxidoreductase, short-chain dehydrogenase/reductase family (EC) n=1 Tax=uncultured Thiotrichaceae bacterium TaxID=298394 RepID=A0A6S6ULA5_9GAMM|nr:MAG: Oxidoreductase, short-chain dehydrogenase/reductase family (EC [uncultured Thiotrichaceae bacterium]
MTPRHVVITGASRGIGAALALQYASQHSVLGLIGRNNQDLTSIATQCEAKGSQVEIGTLDISNTPQLIQWLQSFDETHPIDLLITNAGITNLIGEKGEPESIENIIKVLEVNLHGTIHSIHAILDNMRQRGQGQLALVSSLGAYRGMPITPAYCASKAAVKSYGEALRGWLAPEGIKVNVICPGFVESDMSNSFTAPKPFMTTSDKAASIIKRGLRKNRANISFPFPLNLGMWFISFLPFPIASFFLGISGYNRRH